MPLKVLDYRSWELGQRTWENDLVFGLCLVLVKKIMSRNLSFVIEPKSLDLGAFGPGDLWTGGPLDRGPMDPGTFGPGSLDILKTLGYEMRHSAMT